MIRLFLMVVIVIGMAEQSTGANYSTPVNRYGAMKLRVIATLQNNRNCKELLTYFHDKDSDIRIASIQAFASIQDSMAIDSIATLLSDYDPSVRSAAAYALGQIKNSKAESLVRTAFFKERESSVKENMLEAIGKCGTPEGHSFILSITTANSDSHVLSGIARGLYRFLLKNIATTASTERCLDLVAPSMPLKARFYAANYLGRIKDVDLSYCQDKLLQLVKNEKDVFIKLQLILSLGKVKKPESESFLMNIVNEKGDYRLKVAALRSLSQFKNEKVKAFCLAHAVSTNVHIASVAVENCTLFAVPGDCLALLNTAIRAQTWFARTLLLSSAYAQSLSHDSLKTAINTLIFDLYKKSNNTYEKAYLLSALASDPSQAQFIGEESRKQKGTIIGTVGFQALVDNVNLVKGNDTLKQIYARAFKKGLETGDCGIIATVSPVLRLPEVDFRQNYTDFNFLTLVQKSMKLPNDLEAYQELALTIQYLIGIKSPDFILKNRSIDWALDTTITSKQTSVVNTTKGSFTIQLFVNESPGSVGNFVQLARSNFYNGLKFHRMVSNFVVQGGDPRGDGFGAGAYTIGSELGPLSFEEGAVGFASSGKDTECYQWFVTHIPTPHLDGRYSLFGKVVSGMDVIHKLEIGDSVLSITL